MESGSRKARLALVVGIVVISSGILALERRTATHHQDEEKFLRIGVPPEGELGCRPLRLSEIQAVRNAFPVAVRGRIRNTAQNKTSRTDKSSSLRSFDGDKRCRLRRPNRFIL